MDSAELSLPLGECVSTFSLDRAICNHGYFMMSPNHWNPSTSTFSRPLRLSDSSTSVMASISHTQNSNFLTIRIHQIHALTKRDQQDILKQVRRMLRLSPKDEKSLLEFHALHPEAKQDHFGRIFRSPTLFEDIVKSMLLCNCTTLSMCRSLCEFQSTVVSLSMAKRRKVVPGVSNFPSPIELASVDIELLNHHCKLGYRAEVIIDLAKKVCKGRVKLNTFEEEDEMDKLKKRLMRIKGVGPFTCACIMMCIGFYQLIPIDTETKRHIRETYGITKCTQGSLEKMYGKYAPFQSLAYWMELLEAYEKKVGKLSTLKQQDYSSVTSSPPHR